MNEKIVVKQLTEIECEKHKEELVKYKYESVKASAYREHYEMDSAVEKIDELKTYLKQGKAIAYGAFDNDLLVGFVWSYIYPYREDTNRIYVSVLHVDENYRSQSIGDRLLSCVEEFASEKGYDSVYLHTEAFNSGAIRFYERKGYSLERVQMVKSVSCEK